MHDDLIAAATRDAVDRRVRSRDWRRDAWLAVMAAGIVVVVARETGVGDPARGLAGLGVVAFAVVAIGRTTGLRIGSKRNARVENAVILGAGDVGQLLARKLLRHPEYGINVVGFVDSPPKRWRSDIRDVPVLGPFDELISIVRTFAVDRVIVAFSQIRDEEILARTRALFDLNVRVDVVPRLFEVIGPQSGLPTVEGVPLVGIVPRTRSSVAARFKRALDIVVAGVALVVTAPLFIWAAWRIPRETPGPVFFRQTRLGKDMAEFTMLKFRTMKTDTDAAPHRAYLRETMNGGAAVGPGDLYKMDRDDAVTPTGRWLRRTSLDELPQLLNVLRGTMSLVGPRPCLDYETEHFAPHHYERFRVSPGITGLWQVTARGHASFAEALEMDVAYARDWSLRLDLELLLRTPAEVLRQRKATV
jgi:exopolysaccharide biosynthesis polyprenyl glycosylphosphotransferase